MTLSAAVLRAIIAAPIVAAWAILHRHRILDRLTLAVCRAVYP